MAVGDFVLSVVLAVMDDAIPAIKQGLGLSDGLPGWPCSPCPRVC